MKMSMYTTELFSAHFMIAVCWYFLAAPIKAIVEVSISNTGFSSTLSLSFSSHSSSLRSFPVLVRFSLFSKSEELHQRAKCISEKNRDHIIMTLLDLIELSPWSSRTLIRKHNATHEHYFDPSIRHMEVWSAKIRSASLHRLFWCDPRSFLPSFERSCHI